VRAPAPLAALAVAFHNDVVLAVANTGPDTVRFALPDARQVMLEGFASAWYELPRGVHLIRQTRGAEAAWQ
jgi:hypothetical protein